MYTFGYSESIIRINNLSTNEKKSWIYKQLIDEEVAHHEPPHQDLHCLLSSLWILDMIQLDETIIKIFADIYVMK